MSETTQQDILALPAMVTMSIGRWNQVLEVLGAQPWREVNPVIVDVHRQLQDAINARTAGGNGMSTMRAHAEEKHS